MYINELHIITYVDCYELKKEKEKESGWRYLNRLGLFTPCEL